MTAVKYAIYSTGKSRSFPEGDAFLQNQGSHLAAQVVIYCGRRFEADLAKAAILIELRHECLAEHVSEQDPASANVLGFARYRNGDDPPSRLVELVRHANSSEAAVASAREIFENAGYVVVVCGDQAGRIVDRLVVPKYNAALRFLDEGLASQSDMDITCKLGLGYPDGPIERVKRGGLADYYCLSKALFDAFGAQAYAPPRSAAATFRREGRRSDEGRG
jgi:3-hydroxybutyryl-CoA dehydrogenase